MPVNSRRKGLSAEQAAARYFVAAGCPDARRSVAAGWRNGATSSPDRGDIDGVPGIGIQVKNLAKPLVGKALADVWVETCAQAGGRRPLLLEKRAGAADVGRWYAWLSSGFYLELLTGRRQLVMYDHLVRVELGSIIGDLRIWIRTAQPIDTR